MSDLIISNISIYRAIATEAHQIMQAAGPGYDPDRVSFKQAMIVIVFTGMWLEALLHLLIVRKYGKEKYKLYDRKSYEEKLLLLGNYENNILDSVSRFRKARKELVHEKAHFDNFEFKLAQDEANNAYELLIILHNIFSTAKG